MFNHFHIISSAILSHFNCLVILGFIMEHFQRFLNHRYFCSSTKLTTVLHLLVIFSAFISQQTRKAEVASFAKANIALNQFSTVLCRSIIYSYPLLHWNPLLTLCINLLGVARSNLASSYLRTFLITIYDTKTLFGTHPSKISLSYFL